ncbi:MAG TPA: ATPase domain-containing protein [Nitrososphaerales archaeon]|nr:ATPase domain-containing protein [Nitrososphaerales archaeon]
MQATDGVMERIVGRSVTGKRVPTGIPGLDNLIEGGLQVGDFVLLAGGVGAGKTTFACQFIYNAVTLYDEPAVFATFEEDVESLSRNMKRYGMDLDALRRKDKLRLIDLDVLEGSGMGSNIETIVGALDEVHAKRLVLDSLTAFLSGAKGKFDYAFLMHLIYKTLKRDGITTVMTLSKPQSSFDSGSGIEEFLSDGIFQLESFVTPHMEMKTRFMVRKLRGTDHSRKYHAVAFTSKGVEIIPWTS